MAGTSTGNFPLPWLSEGTLGGAPQLCLLVYKPYQLFLVIHMINHSEIGVMNQLNAILGAPLCNCFPWTLYMVFTSQVTPNYGNCWLWIPMTALLAMEHRVIHQFCRMSPNPTNKYGFPDFIRFHQISSDSRNLISQAKVIWLRNFPRALPPFSPLSLDLSCSVKSGPGKLPGTPLPRRFVREDDVGFLGIPIIL